ncbi:MAG TPA: DeoR/GlpR family DNA-binding transcription regulator [Hyphomicrobiaceae bacterium]|nr:DeoR/GlpR family DNA-binding transcription regulator [Hyphomicrobiaceae bacterium]
MNLSERQRQILAEVRAAGFISIESLAATHGVSTQTVRRDVNMLCDANWLRRRHGGVEASTAAGNIAYDTRQITNIEAKQRIGRRVAALVPSRASVLIGIGSTPEQVAVAMAEHEDLTVVTNNLNVAMALSRMPSNRILLPGGTVRLPDRDLLGPDVEKLFRSFRADFGIFGIGGIDHDGTLLDFSTEEVGARLAIQESCRHTILVADVTKIGRAAPAKGGDVSAIDTVVLDQAPSAALESIVARGTGRLLVAHSDMAAA